MRPNSRTSVKEALQALSEKNPSDLFVTWFSAKKVAECAGCSEGTALKHLHDLSLCAGYRRRLVRGVWGFRYDGPR